MSSKFIARRTKPQPYGGATINDVVPHLQNYQLMVMLDESKGYWCAGWMSGLEDMMWDGSMRDHEAAMLCRKLATVTGVWFRWDDEKHEPVAVPLDEWIAGRDNALGGAIDRQSEADETPAPSDVAVPLCEISGVDHYYTDEGLFRDEPPTPLDATRIAHMLHIITRHNSGWKVEISSDGCYGSGQYQVIISPTCRPIGNECGHGWDDTIESALDWAMGDIDELRPFVANGRYPEGDDDAES